MDNLHGNLCKDMLLNLNQKVCKCLQCPRLSVGFQQILYLRGETGFFYCTRVKIGLGSNCKCHFSSFRCDFPILSCIAHLAYWFKNRIQLFLQIFYIFFKKSLMENIIFGAV